MASYRERVLQDLKAWQEAGWVTPEGAEKIGASLEKERTSFGFATLIGTLGALLLAFGIVAAVAANWQDIPRVGRLGLLTAIMTVAYLTAWVLRRRAMNAFGEAALLVAGAAFAGLIALIGQTYHLGDAFTDLIGLWVAGIFVAALLIGSPVLTLMGIGGSAVWTTMALDASAYAGPHWLSLLSVAAGLVVAVMFRSAAIRWVATLGFFYWVGISIIALAVRNEWNLAETGAISVVIAAAILATALSMALWLREAELHRAFLPLALVALLVAFGLAQLADEPAAYQPWYPQIALGGLVIAAAMIVFAFARGAVALIDVVALLVLAVAVLAFAHFVPSDRFIAGLVGGAIVLAACVWAVALGRAGRVPAGSPLGLTAFGIEIVYIYIATLGTLLDTAFAFLGGGVLFIALSLTLYRIERFLSRRAERQAS